MPPGGLHIRWPRGGMDWAVEQERRLHGPKLAAAQAFARANSLDRVVIDSPQPRLGIVTTGKAYLDVRQALSELGITEQRAAALGIRVYKVALAWPLEPQRALAFAQGLKDILVVEEKRGFVENQLVKLLYNLEASRRPSIVGKTDETGAILLPSTGELTPTMVARAIVARLKRLGDASQFDERLARLEAFERPVQPVSSIQRTPFFCSGCPHNTSTRVPEGSRAMAGIGCHSMALFMPDRHTATLTHMGGEGVNWIGQAPFTTERHVFQNLGDGTYAHSGLMAIRAAAAAGVNITYKILYNDAVAMTGGQPVEGAMTVPQIAQQVLAEGARRVVVVTDEPHKYPKHAGFPAGVAIRHRDDLDTVQRELRDISGLTVLIYDQTCAAEKRRRRKRGKFPDPPERVFINDAVCEGCGDCSDKSNCIAVLPVETELGRKRRIDQSNCNKDFSCLKGFCPSFVTVRGATPRKLGGLAANDSLFANLPEPKAAAARAALWHPRHRRRRHRRRHAGRAPRHGGASRRQRLHRARHQRARAKERRGDEPCAAGAAAGRPLRGARRLGRRRCAARPAIRWSPRARPRCRASRPAPPRPSSTATRSRPRPSSSSRTSISRPPRCSTRSKRRRATATASTPPRLPRR